jgi:hypothetical protein
MPKPRRRDAQRRAETNVTLLHTKVRVPEPTGDWDDATRGEWQVYWTSDVAKLATPESLPGLRRLFDLYAERRVLYGGIRKSGTRLVVGAQQQVRANPIYAVLAAIDTEARLLEDRFGLSPAAKLALGIAYADVGKALDALNAEFEADEADAEPEPDPRRAAIEVRESS